MTDTRSEDIKWLERGVGEGVVERRKVRREDLMGEGWLVVRGERVVVGQDEPESKKRKKNDPGMA